MIKVENRTDASPYINYIYLGNDYRYGTESQRNRWKCYQTVPFTEEDIEKVKTDILNTLSDMGLGNWKIISCEEGEFSLEEFYEGKDITGLEDTKGMRYDLFFRLEPEYSGVPQLIDGWDYRTPALYNDREYRRVVEAPYMTVTYSNGSIIEFEGVGLLKTESITNDVELLPFDKAMEAAQLAEVWDESLIHEHCDFINYTYIPGEDKWEYMPVVNIENASEYKFEIDRIELMYVRTELADDADSFELIPVWAVYGAGYVTEYSRENGTVSAMAQIPYGSGTDMPLLLVSAIDGSGIMLSDKY